MTLVEILIALTIASIMMIGVYEVFVAQRHLYVSTDITAQAQDNGRFAMDSIQRDLSHAGFGVDPGMTFLYYDPVTYSPADYDRPDGPDTLQFLSRERGPLPGANESGCPSTPSDISKRFYWSITSASSTGGITIHVCPGFELQKGTFLLAMCSDASSYAYVRYIGGNLTLTSESDVVIQPAVMLLIASLTDREYPLRMLNNNLDAGCLSDGTAQLHRINFYRYYVRPAQVDAGTGIEIVPPYLMLDPAVDMDGDGDISNDEDDHIPIAEGIEDMQVVFNFLNGKCAGDTSCDYTEVEDLPDLTNITLPAYCDDLYATDTCRVSATSARSEDRLGNTVSVRVSIVARTSIEDPVQGSSAGGGPGGFAPLDVANHIIPQPKPVDGYRRLLFQITVPVINTSAQKAFPFM